MAAAASEHSNGLRAQKAFDLQVALLQDFVGPFGREGMASPEQLDAYLRTNSYLGSAVCATLEDYKVC